MNTSKVITLDEAKRHEIKAEKACRLLFSWNDCVAESEKEYFERVRKINLLTVMKKVIKGELSETQRKALIMKHFEKKSYEEIGQALFMSQSAARRATLRAEAIVSSFMKYVVAMADLTLSKSDRPLDVKMAVAEMLTENAARDKIGLRLRKARKDRCITLEKASLCTGLTKDRINTIEETGSLFSGELKKLIAFYGVSADYIILGAE